MCLGTHPLSRNSTRSMIINLNYQDKSESTKNILNRYWVQDVMIGKHFSHIKLKTPNLVLGLTRGFAFSNLTSASSSGNGSLDSRSRLPVISSRTTTASIDSSSWETRANLYFIEIRFNMANYLPMQHLTEQNIFRMMCHSLLGTLDQHNWANGQHSAPWMQ